ncbi:MAG: serine hydrolase, partial [Thermomicrobiales bacterium]
MFRPFSRRSLIAGAAAIAFAPAIARSTRAAQVTIPATRAGAQLQWIVDQLNSGGKDLKTSDVTPHFTPDYLSALNEQGIIDTFAAMNPIMAPVTIARIEGGITDQHANVLVFTDEGYWRIYLALEFNDPFLIDTFYFDTVTVPDAPDQPRSWGGMKPYFESIAPGSAFISGEIINGEFSQISEYNSDEDFPIASSFKLFVLGAMATQVAAGEHSWAETVTISDKLRSLPSGQLYYEPAGSTYPLEYIVERMTAESDNTATDHTIFTANRNRIEIELGRLGHSRPNLMTPLMYTREWFAMRIHFDDDQVSRYVNATTAERRSILEHTVDPIADTLQEWDEWPGPANSDYIEWFASVSDLAHVLTRLQGFAVSEPTAVVGNALSLFPGIVFD